jgi:acetolactate synthase-1/2/3 large subunit
MKLSDLVFNFIENKGIDTVFTVSGGGCMHLTDSLGKNKKLQYICNHHEQACAMAAESYFRVKNKPGCILVTTGPGGTNTLTGILCAYQDSIPLIVISGQVPTNQLSYNTGCRQIGQQEFNIIDTVKNMTKYSVLISNKNDILYELEKAYHIAVSGRPGPVWIDIPLDIQSSDIDFENLKKFIKYNNYNAITKIINQIKLYQFKKIISHSKKPIIVVGNGIRVSGTVNEFYNFINRLNIPVVTGPHSSVDTINTDYPFYAGRFGLLGQRSSNNIIQESDLVISLGSRLNPKMIGYDSTKFAPNAKKIIIDIDKSEINKLKFKNKFIWNIDLKNFFDIVKNKLYTSDISEWQNKIKQYRINETLVLNKHYNLQNYTSSYVLSKKLENYLNDNSIIVTSDGTAHVVPLKTISLKGNQRLFSNEGTAPMGYGLPASIGAYYGSKSPIICIEGDGSIMMNLQELETIRYHDLPIKIIILNNNGYLSIRLTQNSFFKGELHASDISSGVSIPSFKKIANAFDYKYFSINNNSEIDAVLHKVFSDTTRCIVEVFTDPNEQHEPKVKAKGIDANGKIIPGELTDI